MSRMLLRDSCWLNANRPPSQLDRYFHVSPPSGQKCPLFHLYVFWLMFLFNFYAGLRFCRSCISYLKLSTRITHTMNLEVIPKSFHISPFSLHCPMLPVLGVPLYSMSGLSQSISSDHSPFSLEEEGIPHLISHAHRLSRYLQEHQNQNLTSLQRQIS